MIPGDQKFLYFSKVLSIRVFFDRFYLSVMQGFFLHKVTEVSESTFCILGPDPFFELGIDGTLFFPFCMFMPTVPTHRVLEDNSLLTELFSQLCQNLLFTYVCIYFCTICSVLRRERSISNIVLLLPKVVWDTQDSLLM